MTKIPPMLSRGNQGPSDAVRTTPRRKRTTRDQCQYFRDLFVWGQWMACFEMLVISACAFRIPALFRLNKKIQRSWIPGGLRRQSVRLSSFYAGLCKKCAIRETGPNSDLPGNTELADYYSSIRHLSGNTPQTPKSWVPDPGILPKIHENQSIVPLCALKAFAGIPNMHNEPAGASRFPTDTISRTEIWTRNRSGLGSGKARGGKA